MYVFFMNHFWPFPTVKEYKGQSINNKISVAKIALKYTVFPKLLLIGTKAATVIKIIFATLLNGLWEKIRIINVIRAKFRYKKIGPIRIMAGPNITKPYPI